MGIHRIVAVMETQWESQILRSHLNTNQGMCVLLPNLHPVTAVFFKTLEYYLLHFRVDKELSQSLEVQYQWAWLLVSL